MVVRELLCLHRPCKALRVWMLAHQPDRCRQVVRQWTATLLSGGSAIETTAATAATWASWTSFTTVLAAVTVAVAIAATTAAFVPTVASVETGACIGRRLGQLLQQLAVC